MNIPDNTVVVAKRIESSLEGSKAYNDPANQMERKSVERLNGKEEADQSEETKSFLDKFDQ